MPMREGVGTQLLAVEVIKEHSGSGLGEGGSQAFVKLVGIRGHW